MGLAQVQQAIKAKEDYLAGKGGGGGGSGGGQLTFMRKLQFWENQTKRCRFNGEVTEPVVLRYHSLKDDKYPILCAFQFEEPRPGEKPRDDGTYRGEYVHLMQKPHPGCVYCHQYNMAGDKRIGFSTRGVAAIVDMELYHKVPASSGATDRNGNVYINDELCSNDGRCPYCRVPDETISDRFYGGQSKWEIPLKSATALLSQIENISKYCSCCWPAGAALGKGIIQTLNYTCTNDQCGVDISIDEYNPSESLFHTCAACGVRDIPLETAACTLGCEGARRTTMWDGDWAITRSGSGQMTSYSFNFLGVSPPEEWVLELEAPELMKETKPSSTKKMAEKLGVQDPFEGNQQVPRGGAPPQRRGPAPVGNGPAPALTGRQPPQQPRVLAPQPAAQVQRFGKGPSAPQVQSHPVGARQAPAPQYAPRPVQQAPAPQPGVGYVVGREPRPAGVVLAPKAPVGGTQRVAAAPAPTGRVLLAPKAPVTGTQRAPVAPPVAAPTRTPVGGGGRIVVGGGRPTATQQRPSPGYTQYDDSLVDNVQQFGPGKDDDIPY